MPLWVAEVSADTARQAGVWLHPLGAVASYPDVHPADLPPLSGAGSTPRTGLAVLPNRARHSRRAKRNIAAQIVGDRAETVHPRDRRACPSTSSPCVSMSRGPLTEGRTTVGVEEPRPLLADVAHDPPKGPQGQGQSMIETTEISLIPDTA